jgi:hypothetical protein
VTIARFEHEGHPDLPSTFVHFTGRTRDDSDPPPSWSSHDPEQRLVQILQSGRIRARNTYGTRGAVVCVSEPSDAAIRYLLGTGPNWRGAFAPWGLLIDRARAIAGGFRPVLHVSAVDWQVVRQAPISANFHDRRVNYNPEQGIDWLHEREWRFCAGLIDSDPSQPGVDVPDLVVGVITGKPDWYPPPTRGRTIAGIVTTQYAASCDRLPRFLWNGQELVEDGEFDLRRRMLEDDLLR